MIELLQEAVDIGLMHKCETLGCERLILRKDKFCESCIAEGFGDRLYGLQEPSQATIHELMDEERERC